MGIASLRAIFRSSTEGVQRGRELTGLCFQAFLWGPSLEI